MKALSAISEQKIRWLLPLVLVLVSFLQYANTLKHEYVWDDAIVITENPRMQEGLGNPLDFFDKDLSPQIRNQYGYRPVTLLTFALDISLFGANPGPGHFMNLFWFSLLILVMFFTLKNLFPNQHWALPFFTTLLFAVHPVHVEVVANIKSRDEILGLLFGLAGLWWILQGLRKEKWWLSLVSLPFFGLALLSRENAVTMLPMAGFAIFIVPGVSRKTRFFSLAPLLLILGAGLFFLLSSTQGQGPVLDNPSGDFIESRILGNPLAEPHLYSHRAATSVRIVGQYLKNFLAPYPLVYFYGYNHFPVTTWSDPLVWVSLLALLGLVVLAVWRFRKNPPLAFGIFWFFVTISIYANLVRILDDIMADRFLFMPSLGLCLALVSGIGILTKTRFTQPENTVNHHSKKKKKAQRVKKKSVIPVLFLGIMGVLVLAGFFRTFDRNRVWKDNLTLYSADLHRLENAARPHYYYATALYQKWQENPSDGNLPPKIQSAFERAIEITPHSFYAYLNLGRAQMQWGDPAGAMTTLQACRTAYPEMALPALELGTVCFQTGQFGQAIPHLQDAIQFAPELSEAYLFLSQAQLRTGKPKAGLATVNQGIAKTPEAFYLYNSQSDIKFALGDTSGSLQALRNIIEIAPDFRPAYEKLGQRYGEIGNQDSLNWFFSKAQTLPLPQ